MRRTTLLFFPLLLFVSSFCAGQINGPTNSISEANFSGNNLVQLDNNIRSVFQDKQGVYWVGTNGAGVFRYDSKTMRQFTVADGLADNQITNIQEDESGNIWVGTGAFGVSKYDGFAWMTFTDQMNLTGGTESDWQATNTDLWFPAGGGVLRYNGSTMDYLPFGTASLNSPNNLPFSLSRYGVYVILKDTKGNLWFGTQAEGVCLFDGKTLTWFKEKGLAGPAVLGLFEDHKGNIWFGNNGAGLFRYDGKELINFTQEHGLGNADFTVSGKAGIGTLARVYAINEDNSGNIWVGTVDAGVWKYDGNNLTHFTTTEGLTSNAVNSIYRDKNGELWFGTDANGICKFNGKSFYPFEFAE